MDWNWSFRAFRVLGTEVRIHWTLPAFFLYYVMRAARHGPSATFLALFVVTPFVLLFMSVLAHELGHVLAARHYGLHVGRTVLTPIGGMVMVGQANRPASEFVVAAAGPFVNLLLAGVGLTLYLALGGPFGLSMLVPLAGDDAYLSAWSAGGVGLLVLRDFVEMNAVLFWFNVLTVAYPMDGGRMLLATLWKRLGFRRALEVATIVSRVIAVALAVVAIVTYSPLLIVIAVMLWVQSTMVRRQLAAHGELGFGVVPSWQPRKPRAPGPGRPGRWRFGALSDWLDRRRIRRQLELLAKAEVRGIGALRPSEREFLRKHRSKLN